MANNEQYLAPGTLENTRKNIGQVDEAEAKLMQQKLGGEILKERPVPMDPSLLPRNSPTRRVVKSSGLSSADVSAKSAAVSMKVPKSSPSVNKIVSSTPKLKNNDEGLPLMSVKDLKLIDALMMSPEYNIKPNYGLFNVFYRMSQKNRRRLSRDYGEYTLRTNLEHLQAFITTMKTVIQISPDTYKAKIATDTELKFKFLRTVGKWTMKDIKLLSLSVQNEADNLTISMLKPLVCAVYHELLTIYYIGEKRIPAIIKEIFADIVQYPKINREQVQELAKQGITEWLYVYDQLIKGMYPLLMRMCGSEYAEFPQFFTTQIAHILPFVGLSKFDLLVPEKKKEQPKEEQKEAKQEPEKTKHIAGEKDDLVEAGLKILEQLFPDSGFSNLERNPDMYPYFQPLYRFEDGFNMLSPQNGIQVTVVLLRIIDDLFHGCRNINFNLKSDETLGAMVTDSVAEIMSDWGFYEGDLFSKNYGDYLREYVNTVYTQKDYPNTQFGKEMLNNMLWRTKFYFLPSFKFNAPILTRPTNDSKYKPLYSRTDFIKTVFTTLARRIDENQIGKQTVIGVMNPWDRYVFDIPNVVSKRLDVLLGAKKSDDTTNATNANLIKYTLCVMSVLDWWINNPTSPAYTGDAMEVYRRSLEDGSPEFSVPERHDQNQLFAEAVKRAFTANQK